MVRMIFDDTETGAKPKIMIEADGTSDAIIVQSTYLLKEFMRRIPDSDKAMFQETLQHFIVEDHDE